MNSIFQFVFFSKTKPRVPTHVATSPTTMTMASKNTKERERERKKGLRAHEWLRLELIGVSTFVSDQARIGVDRLELIGVSTFVSDQL